MYTDEELRALNLVVDTSLEIMTFLLPNVDDDDEKLSLLYEYFKCAYEQSIDVYPVDKNCICKLHSYIVLMKSHDQLRVSTQQVK